MIIIISIHTLILVAISSITALLLHYQKNYSLPENRTRMVSMLFLALIGILMITSTVFLFFVPWEYVPDFFSRYAPL